MFENNIIEIKKTKDEEQIVMGEVYAPDITDAHGDFMTAPEIKKMAYDFMANQRLHKIDMQHDNQETGSFIVESFIARKGDETFIEGAWVVGVHIPDQKIWKMIKSNELNGFSMEALAFKKENDIEMICPLQLTGRTEKSEDGHTHTYTIFIDEDGNFNGGTTNLVNNHKHDIITGTTTEEEEGHTHKYNYVDMLVELRENEEEDNS